MDERPRPVEMGTSVSLSPLAASNHESKLHVARDLPWVSEEASLWPDNAGHVSASDGRVSWWN
jgi:hypothetical protein